MSMRYIFFLAIALIFFSCETDWGKYGGYAMDYDSALEYYIILAYSCDFGHPIPLKADTQSRLLRTVNPVLSGHFFAISFSSNI
ncbi:MAG: hypothetical protein K8R58_13650, partial [Bacteroidales bacterium]|nr:hypothetical protein [Bacteroidales bacterium]